LNGYLGEHKGTGSFELGPGELEQGRCYAALALAYSQQESYRDCACSWWARCSRGALCCLIAAARACAPGRRRRGVRDCEPGVGARRVEGG
jgi:hypothetical protein